MLKPVIWWAAAALVITLTVVIVQVNVGLK
jgi:hypothetical protein